ncbi:tRNA-dihydrouridine synthase 2 [Umbelopsis sp. WA50703]
MVDYANKVVLAPMVRVGTLPMRLLALDYGADLVWTEETVDKKIIGCERKLNPATGTIEYLKNGRPIFVTHPDEKGRVIFQVGTADPDLALQAALTVKDDVAGIDVNCGCPKKFSIQGGMGAALLSNQPKLKKILENLVANAGLPVTCKIRILETAEQTRELVKMVESTGVKAITVHCRTKDMRSSQKAQWDALKDIVDTVKTIPVIANGDVFEYGDIQRLKDHTNVSSVMVARGAQWNPSVFRKEGKLAFQEAATAYLKKCIEVDNIRQNTKYVLLTLDKEDSNHTKSAFYLKMMQAKSIPTYCELFGIEEFYKEQLASQQARRKAAAEEVGEDSIASKRKIEGVDNPNTTSDIKIQRTEDKPVEQVTKTAIEA